MQDLIFIFRFYSLIFLITQSSLLIQNLTFFILHSDTQIAYMLSLKIFNTLITLSVSDSLSIYFVVRNRNKCSKIRLSSRCMRFLLNCINFESCRDSCIVKNWRNNRLKERINRNSWHYNRWDYFYQNYLNM